MPQLKLLRGVPFHKDYINTMKFSSSANQKTYFDGLAIKTIPDNLYVRTNKQIKVTGNVEDYWDINYIMFQNKTKWYYAFVDSVEYLSNQSFTINFSIDVMQTYQFDWNLKTSFVEREHVSDDTIGKHIIDEGLAVGEYVSNYQTTFSAMQDMCIIMAVTEYPDGGTLVPADGFLYGLNYSGLAYIAFDIYDFYGVNLYLQQYAELGKLDAVVSIFMFPANFLSFTSGEKVVTSVTNTLNQTVNKVYALDGYTPKNNKLLCSPYNMLYVSNNLGNSATYNFEDFNGGACTFLAYTALSPNPTVSAIPQNYKNISQNQDERITMGEYPQCSWNGDVYAQWLAQNAFMSGLGVAGSALALAGGIATAQPFAVAGGAIGLAQSFGGFYQASLQPNQARGNVGGGNTDNALGIHNFQFYGKSIKAEIAKVLDDFFEKFGYKVNDLKTPSLTGRPYWNYVKTNEVNITGNIPNDHMTQIKDNFNKGITFWHDSDVGNYNRNNH